MAKMNINIINPTISLISRPNTSSSKCESTFEFTIRSTPNASITIAATLPTDILTNDDLREFSYDLGSGYNLTITSFNNPTKYPFVSNMYIRKRDIILNNTGEAKVRVVLSNSEEAGKYYTTKVFIKDNTNNKEETKEFTRYDDSVKCKVGSEPIARNDNYTVTSGTHKNLDITKNDERLHYIPDYNKITFVTLPQHGTVTFIFGVANYINNGDGATSDSFTYTVETPDGLSNVATVTINIEAKAVISTSTKINIWIDGSGSLTYERGVLEDIKNNELKTKLLKFYDDEDDYNKKVQVLNTTGNHKEAERFLRFVSSDLSQEGNTIAFIFQNEANTESTFFNIEKGYHDSNCGFSEHSKRLKAYDEDINTFHSRIDNYQQDYYLALFPIELCDGFGKLIEAMVTGIGNFNGKKGLSTLENVMYEHIEGFFDSSEIREIYTDKIVNALTTLGFNIT